MPESPSEPTAEPALSAELDAAVTARLERAVAEDVVGRIWRRDDTVWGPAGRPEVADRLGWLDAADPDPALLADVAAFAEEVRDEGCTDVVLLGMGGSSLAPEVVHRSFGAVDGRPAFHMLDSTDATAVREVEEAVDLTRTLFVVATKSGGTIETRSALDHFDARVRAAVGEATAGGRFVAITDPGSALVDLAETRGFRRTFLGVPEIGGRYSAMSVFGLLPAALMGADLEALAAGARRAAAACAQGDPAANPGLRLGVAIGELAARGRDKLTFVVDPPLGSLGLWLEQLVAESTGKEGRGSLPVADEPLGDPGVYGEDRVFAHVRVAGAPATELAGLAGAGHPVLTIDASGPGDLGAVFVLAEFATAVAGWVLGINPFDQPDVQSAKDATNAVLDEARPDAGPDADDAALAALVRGLAAPEYLAVMAYAPPSAELDAAADDLRRVVRDATRATTTFGYGPRFLHSTGQFHKGGPRTGRFLQLVADSSPELPIPGRPYGFETLKRAQALGDLRTLRATGRPAERVTLPGDDPAGALRALTARLEEHL